ncbi:uncharacterized protein LOC123664936 [Melitaea cinxia]|uniref:uncharacterized protein LOC123664936 n=1 Tax=Melitaea cinxia TaxID=113334 RepID=UPI001E2736D2|nr:uncharacterized protein LOC123664936 [Melitaea cinxia]
MESHMLNMYHQARFRGIGHTTPQSTTESSSPESSCNQSSPEYAMKQKTSQFKGANEETFWDSHNDSNAWTRNKNVNMTQTNPDTSTEEENADINVINDYEASIAVQIQNSSLVEGDDYEIVQVYEVNPFLDLEASSDEDEDDNEANCLNEDGYDSEYGEDPISEHEELAPTHNISENSEKTSTRNVPQDSLGINFDTPVVTNIDEYFVKPNVNNILKVKNEHVVKDVDEYFIKDTKKLKHPSVVDYFKDEVPKTLPLEIFAPDNTDTTEQQQNHEVIETVDNIAEDRVTESDMDVLPNIEDLKRFILEEPPYNKFKTAQKSHSVSLPHSPIHNLNLDPDAKGCLTFEDLNLDLLDLSLENDREKLNTKNDDMPRTLTDDDVNSFLITDKKESNQPVKNEDDFSLQDMDMDCPVDAIIDTIGPVSAFQLPDRKLTSTPLPILEYCVKKTQVKIEPEIKLEKEDFVDVESCPETAVPVLEASTLDSLLEQFEATENLSTTDVKPIVSEKLSEAKCSLTSGMRLQDAGVQLNKTKMKKILMAPKVNTLIKRSPSPIHSDHDYCSPRNRRSLTDLKGGRSLLKPEVLSSNNRILNSRHRSCKNKKVVYHLSSDDEADSKDKKKPKIDDNDIITNKKSRLKTSLKPRVNRKKHSRVHSVVNVSGLTKNNDSVIVENASKATSDNSSSQKSNCGSIKLVIKNKSKVIIQNCDVSDLNKDISCEKSKSSKAYSSSSNKVSTDVSNVLTSIQPLDRRRISDKVLTNINRSVDPLDRSTLNKQSINGTNIAQSVETLDRSNTSNKVSTYVNDTVKHVDPLHGSNTSHKESTHVKNIVKSGESLDRISTSNKVSTDAKITDKMFQSSDRSSASKKLSRHVKNSVKSNEPFDRSNTSKNISKYVKNADKSIESKGRSNTLKKESSNVNNIVKSVESEPLDRVKNKNENREIKETLNVKHEENSKQEHFYTALFNNKEDVRVPKAIDVTSKVTRKDEGCKVTLIDVPIINEVEQPVKKKKLNLKEYKLRISKGISSNDGSPQVSPESIFPETPCNINLDKKIKISNNVTPNNVSPPKENLETDAPKAIFDPILEASRKVLMNIQKQKAKASKRQESVLIQKVENLVLQPLISDEEMLKIVGMTPNVMPVPVDVPTPREQPKDYDEIILVSIGTNTDEGLLKPTEKQTLSRKRKLESPQRENKSTINFKIKKMDSVLKQNVFETVKNQKSPIDDRNRSDIKIDKERYKDITATLKSVEKHVDKKISSNSLFASIQDLVKKKAPTVTNSSNDRKSSKSNSPVEEKEFKYTKPTIVREYDNAAPHGEDKVILHLEKNRQKPEYVTTCIQTEATAEFVDLPKIGHTVTRKQFSVSPRKRNDSDMSMSSDCSPIVPKNVQNVMSTKLDEGVNVKSRTETRHPTEVSQYHEKRSRSRSTRYDVKYRRSRSQSRNHRRKRSPSRNRSRSRGHYRRYRRSDSPYRRKRRSRTRSPYRSSRRSPSVRRHYRSNHSRSTSKITDRVKSRSPIAKKRPSPQYIVNNIEKLTPISLTPPMRKPTISASSESSSCSSSSSGSSSSGLSASSKSKASCSPNRKEEVYRAKSYRSSYSSEDRDSATPVEERRIVFVGRLDKDITKLGLKSQFVKFGPITEVRLHSKEDGSRYGFLTFQRPMDAWSAVEAGKTFPQYDVGFGGRRAFCRQSYADLDGLEAKYTESAFHGQAVLPIHRNNDNMSFDQMLLDMKKTLNKMKGDKKSDDMSA